MSNWKHITCNVVIITVLGVSLVELGHLLGRAYCGSVLQKKA